MADTPTDGVAEARAIAEAAAARGNKVAQQIVRQMQRDARKGRKG